MHSLRLPLRWSDLDTLNHVNNVRFLDYAAEARAVAEADGLPASGHGPTALDVQFLAPLRLERRWVDVLTSTDGPAVVQEVVSDPEDGGDRVVHARLHRAPSAGPDPSWPALARVSHAGRLRLTDVGRDGLVTEAQVAEVFQESRIAALWGARGTDGGRIGPFAVARIVQHYTADLAWSCEPVTLGNRLAHLGTRSAVVHGSLAVGDRCVATAEVTVVAFDATTQRSRVIDDGERVVLGELLG